MGSCPAHPEFTVCIGEHDLQVLEKSTVDAQLGGTGIRDTFGLAVLRTILVNICGTIPYIRIQRALAELTDMMQVKLLTHVKETIAMVESLGESN